MGFVRAGDFTRLEEVCRILGHQGGTIHQCNDEAEGCLGRSFDIIAMTETEYYAFVVELSNAWPSYVAFHAEQEREYQ